MGVLMSLLFATLTVEMVILALMVLPLPLKIRQQLFKLYTKLYNSREVRTVAGICGVFVGLLFADSLKSTWKLKTGDTGNFSEYKSTYQHGTETMARIFYNQRNVYISGAVMFIGVAIPTVFNIIQRLIKYEELRVAMRDPKKVEARLVELKAELESKEKQVGALEKQKTGLEKSYDELADKLNAGTATSDKKKD